VEWNQSTKKGGSEPIPNKETAKKRIDGKIPSTPPQKTWEENGSRGIARKDEAPNPREKRGGFSMEKKTSTNMGGYKHNKRELN